MAFVPLISGEQEKEKMVRESMKRLYEKTILEVSTMSKLYEAPSGQVFYRLSEDIGRTYDGTVFALKDMAITPHGRVQPESFSDWQKDPGRYGSYYVVARVFTTKCLEGFWAGGSLLYMMVQYGKDSLEGVSVYKDRRTVRRIAESRGGVAL